MQNLDRALSHIHRQDEEARARALAAIYHLPYVNLVGYPILARTISIVPLADAVAYGVVPYLKANNRLRVATADPTPKTLAYIQRLANHQAIQVDVALCSTSSLQFALNLAKIEQNKTGDPTKIAITKKQSASAIAALHSKDQIETTLAHASATEVLDILFAGATGMNASDIHLEPQENNVRVRFRLDGVLHEITLLSPDVYHQVLSRVKYLAKMKLDIKSNAQDGRFTIESAGSDLDVRVSTLPSSWGEILDMRLLRAHAEMVSLDELGLSPDGLDALKAAVKLPHGMVLVTGPTGSGKTTTLYAVLQYLNQPGVKIITLEDPIEYRLPGIDQVEISHDKGGLTFAEGLKGALRQDPDILLVGEIRDRETAEIGLSAAMTGHLFLSTLHTNNAPASLARLLDMGIEPYKIAGTINLIVAQRLVRRLCPHCHAAGCEICYATGFKGRIPILEYLKPSKALDDAIVRHAPVSELYDIAIRGGMIPMREDGLKKVAAGLTTQAEVERVTAENIQPEE